MTRVLLRLCAFAYPRGERAVVLSLAEELVADGASARREAAGLLRAGLHARLPLARGPWGAALARLGLPLAGLLLAAILLGIEPYERGRLVWIGWSWAAGLAGAVAAMVGLALGRRRLALPGAVLVAGLCLVDGFNDLHGPGSRWVAAWIDVLPALLPAALVLVAAAAHPRPHGARAAAWALAGTATLVVAALAVRAHTTTGTTVLAGGAVLLTGMTLRGVLPGARAPDRLAAAIALATAAPAAAWSVAGALPAGTPDSVGRLVLCAAGLSAITAILELARRAAPPHPPPNG